MAAPTTNRIVFENVSKAYSLGGGRKLLRGHARDWFKPREIFFALRDVSLQVRDGESVAVIGPNGAGKSTLLNLTTRLCYPDEGSVTVKGRVSAVLELGGGFHPDLTGEENLRLAASLQGLSRTRTDELRDVIVEFAGKQFSEFKAALTDLAVAKLGPVGAEMQRLMNDPGHVDAVMRNGAERARALAAPILAEVYRTVGFLKP